MNYNHDSQILSYDLLVRSCCRNVIHFQRLRNVGRIISQVLELIIFSLFAGCKRDGLKFITMMGHKDKLKNGMEYDVIYARKLYCYLINNSKLTSFVKTCINRRNRRKSKLELNKF